MFFLLLICSMSAKNHCLFEKYQTHMLLYIIIHNLNLPDFGLKCWSHYDFSYRPKVSDAFKNLQASMIEKGPYQRKLLKCQIKFTSFHSDHQKH